MGKRVLIAVMMILSLFTVGIGLTEVQAALPDLKVADLVVQDYTASGVKIFITDVTKNQGGARAGASFTRFWISPTTAVGPGISLGKRYVPPLAPGTSNTGSIYVEIPDVSCNPCYIIAKADAFQYVTESREGNNKRVKSIAVYSTGDLPDLDVSALTAPGSASPGQIISINDTTMNNGPITTFGTVTVFYLSTNNILDASDKSLLDGSYGFRLVPALISGASNSGTAQVKIPLGTPAGEYYIIAEADGYKIVSETNEDNNWMSTATKITIIVP